MKTPGLKSLRFYLFAALVALVIAFSIFASVAAYRHSKIHRLSFENRMSELELAAVLEGVVADCRLSVQNGDFETLLEQAEDLRVMAASLPQDTGAGVETFQEQTVLLVKSVGERRNIPENLSALERSLVQLNADLRAGVAEAARQENDFFVQVLMIYTGVFAFCAALILTAFYIVTRVLARSLHELTTGTRELRSGNLEYRFRDITQDEIGEVKYDFNLMARRLEKQAAELSAANSELRAQAEELIAAHQHKDRFLSNMSHELRTPLNSIIGFSELIEARGEKLPPEKLISYSRRIQTAADHLLELITTLLDLAKSGAGTLQAVPVCFDLSFTVQELCELLAPLARKKGLELQMNITPGIQVCADQRMIRQIFINLFGNAVKYTLEGSVNVLLEKQGNSCSLTVKDTGIGIPENEQKNIFRDFHRVENAAKIVVDGVGIGLALSRRLAALNHGGITFVSKEKSGSAFTLSLPLS